MDRGQLVREFAERAQALQLHVECLGDGDLNSEILVLAEAPGQREVDMKVPLVGGSGRFLWEALRPYGIDRRHCYITNVIKRRIVEIKSKSGTSKEAISKNELSHWQGLLNWEISKLPNVRYVLVLGARALEATLGPSSIEEWRGSVLENEGRQHIVTYNPAFILRKPLLEPIFKLDMRKLDMVMRGAWQPYHIDPIINPSPIEAIRFCDKMIDERLPISTDIEVIGNETACVGFANDAHTGMCINFRGREHNRFSIRDELRVRSAISRVLGHSRSQLIAQNGGFDCGWLWYKDRIKVRPLYIDTLLGHHTLHPTWPHNLGFLTAQYTTHPFYKDEKDAWREGGDINSFWEYNVKDCCITLAAAGAIERDLKRVKLWEFFQGHVMRLQPHLIASTVLGNLVDADMRARLNADFGADVDRLRAEFVNAVQIATGDSDACPNPNSPKQLSELFFRRLALTGKNASTNKENREAMINNPRTSPEARAMLKKLNEYAEVQKLYSTYVTAAVDEDGRMRSDYKQYGTQFVPGRLSSSSTLWGSGMNLQNQPERLRGMFIADKMEFPE